LGGNKRLKAAAGNVLAIRQNCPKGPHLSFQTRRWNREICSFKIQREFV